MKRPMATPIADKKRRLFNCVYAVGLTLMLITLLSMESIVDIWFPIPQ